MSSSFSPGRLVGGQYRIEREIGRGGMSTVYLARDEPHERDVAVKVLLASLTGALSADDFISEIRTTARLSDPHILKLLDSGKEDGAPFYVTDFVRGESLRERLTRQGALSLDESLRIGSMVALALAHAHAEGVIHRDVKPGNVLLDGRGNAYLADFGIARALSATDTLRTSTGEIVGTLRYMSPEQFEDVREIDGRSDIYSLACVIFEMLAGEPLFKARSPQAMMAAHLYQKPRLLRSVRADVPTVLDDLLQSALAKEPADRIQTAAEVGRRLDDLLASVRVGTHPPGPAPVAEPVEGKVMGADGSEALALPRNQDEDHTETNVWAYSLTTVAMLLLGAVAWAAAADAWPFRGRAVLPDTTRYVVLPFQRDGAAADLMPLEVHIEEGFRRWEDVTVVDGVRVEDLLAGASDPRRLTNQEVLEVMRATGAGRVVAGQARRVGDSVRVDVRLSEGATSLEPLARATFMSGLAPSDAGTAIARAIESLLVGSISATAEPLVEHTRSVAAARRFLAGDAARQGWSLAEAERSFAEAAVRDPSFGLALFWKAQVTSWRGRPSRDWEIDARRAMQASARLSARERQLASALVAMAEERYPEACDLYEELRTQDPNDFAALFGLGECRRRDPLVVPDAGSRTGWSFRASAHAAVTAYRTAFESFPSSFRGFGAGEPELLRSLLYAAQGTYRQGRGPPPEGRAFIGFREWRADSLAFVVVPMDSAGAFRVDAQARADAVIRQRRALLDVANALALAFPQSSGALHTLALARELVGDASALATYAQARRLATQPEIRAEIGTNEVILRLRLSIPSDTSALRAAVALGDSILAEAVDGSVAAQDRLSELATLLGRPELAARLSGAGVGADRLGSIPAEVVREADVLLAFAAVGAPVDSIRAVEVRIERLIMQTIPGPEQRAVRQFLLEQSSFLAFPNHRLAYLDSASLPLGREARAIAELASGGVDSAIGILGDPPAEAGWDVLIARANVLLAAGRDRSALDLLRAHFGGLATADPAEVRGPARLGGLVRATVLQAQLEEAVGSREAAISWARVAQILWSTGEGAVGPALERLGEIRDSQDIR